jgi:outer membrane protein OmpA-like peptidoglycan-associated protein
MARFATLAAQPPLGVMKTDFALQHLLARTEISFMSLNSSDDSQERFALGFLFALIALVVSIVVGTVVYKRGIAHAPKAEVATPAANATNVPVVIQEDVASVIVEDGVVKFYFASGKAEVAEGGNAALADVVKGVQDGKRAVISGFHDATGSVEVNAELAKQRAQAVQAALLALGVAEDKVELKKPEQMQADGSNAQARRVEVILVD